MAAHEVRFARVYGDADGSAGLRILVDRLWPRGLSKQRAGLDEWCQEAAPSSILRQWYAHDPQKFDEFSRRYRAELDDADHAAAVEHLRELARHHNITLLTATKELGASGAAVLAEFIGT